MHFLKNFWFTIKSRRKPKLTDAKTKKRLKQHNLHDEQLVQFLMKKNKKLPAYKQVKYIHKLLTQKEKFYLKILVSVIIVGLIFIGVNSYLNLTHFEPKYGGEYTEGLVGAPQYINPILAQTNDVDLDLSSIIFNGLLKYDSNNGLINDLAEEFTISEDQKTYTFVLKDYVYWHDGQKLTANDVLFTFDRIKDPNTKSPLIFNFSGATIEKIDDKTIKFTLEEPFAPFTESLAVGILPEHIWKNIPAQNMNLSEFNLKPIGSGPYKFKSLNKEKTTSQIKSYTLEANEDYFDSSPYIETLTFKFYSSFDMAINALNNKNIEGISYLPKDKAESLINTRNLNLHSLNLPQYTALFFNSKKNTLLKTDALRKLISHSIDKDKIISEILDSQAQKIDGPILPGTLGYTDDFVKYPFDLEYAKAELEKLGWELTDYETESATKPEEDTTEDDSASDDQETSEETEETTDTEAEEAVEEIVEEPAQPEEAYPFKVRKKGSNYLEFTLTTVDQPENIQIAKMIQSDLQQAGIKLNIVTYSSEEINREAIKPRNYEILLYGEILGYDPDPYAFWHSSQVEHPGLNLSLLADNKVDELLEDARKTNDNEIREEKYIEFQKLLAEKVPAIFLFNPTYIYPQSKKINGFDNHTIITPANRLNNINHWFVKTKRKF